MAREALTVKLIDKFTYERSAYTHGTEIVNIYKFSDVADEAKIYVWKTTSLLTLKYEDPHGCEEDSKGRRWSYREVNKYSVLAITATIKGTSEYKGEPQIELNRVKVVEIVSEGKTWEQIQKEKEMARAARKDEQLASLTGKDFVWTMPYKQYKEHYSDCETVIDSFERRGTNGCFISVIIREGRLKESGVRGMRFYGWEFRYTDTADGKEYITCYRAVSEENALKQLRKDLPTATNIRYESRY